MEDIQIATLGTAVGIGLFLKVAWIPFLKLFLPLQGRWTVLAAIASGVSWSVAYSLATRALDGSGWLEAILRGIAAGWIAFGAQTTMTAIFRPEKS